MLRCWGEGVGVALLGLVAQGTTRDKSIPASQQASTKPSRNGSSPYATTTAAHIKPRASNVPDRRGHWPLLGADGAWEDVAGAGAGDAAALDEWLDEAGYVSLCVYVSGVGVGVLAVAVVTPVPVVVVLPLAPGVPVRSAIEVVLVPSTGKGVPLMVVAPFVCGQMGGPYVNVLWPVGTALPPPGMVVSERVNVSLALVCAAASGARAARVSAARW